LKIKPEQLTRTLTSTDSAIYWLAGDEPLLMQEAAAAIVMTNLICGFLHQ
jgi:DNA polymerase III delta subunit